MGLLQQTFGERNYILSLAPPPLQIFDSLPLSLSFSGLACSAFVDYGNEFAVHDVNGENCRSAIVVNIEKDEQGLVTVHDEKRHGFEDGDYVVFREVKRILQTNIPPIYFFLSLFRWKEWRSLMMEFQDKSVTLDLTRLKSEILQVLASTKEMVL